MKCVPNKLYVLFLCSAIAGSVLAQSSAPSSSQKELSAALLQTTKDIERDTEALNRLRDQIVKDRKPLATELDALQKSVAQKRTEVERARTIRLQGEKAHEILVAEVSSLEEELRFIQTLVSEYARTMDMRAGSAESLWLKTELKSIALSLSDRDSFDGMAADLDALMKVSSKWRDLRIGGFQFSGSALDQQGIEQSGQFAVFGPLAYFSTEDNRLAGMAVTQFGSVLPSVFNRFTKEEIASIAQVVQRNEATVPMDVTSGDAIKIVESKDSFVVHVKKGGFVMWPLLAVGFVAFGLIVYKAIALNRVKVTSNEIVSSIIANIKQGKRGEAEKMAGQLSFPLNQLMQEAISHAEAPREHLEEILHEHVLSALPKLESCLGALAVLGGVAPLLGLLGTVTGMIHTFQLVTLFGSGDAKLLSGGISEALITTEFGLAIAIPVLLAHAFLARRAGGVISALEQTAISVVNDLKVRQSA